MKKTVMIVLGALVLLGSMGMTAFAAETESVQVYVTIADANGDLALAQESVTVTDADGDGVRSIHDALYAAHEAGYEGGAAAGYEAVNGEYGLSLQKLWGAANGGSYGYYVNDVSAYSLADPVSQGDRVSAFVYTDVVAWSDTYCWFDTATVTAKEGEEVTLTLTAAGYDDAWNPITLPVAGAAIVIDGTKSEYTTDTEGNVTLTLSAGEHVISAMSDTATLVPPVCKATVEAVAATTTTTVPATGPAPEFPKTGVAQAVVPAMLAAGVACAAVLMAARKNQYE